jgi:NitT/TauT family transport system substrate-binding protein
LLFSTCTFSANRINLAVLQFGTVNWELDVIKRHGLDQAEGFTLEARKMAGKQATMVALQAGSVDIAVSDWIWVSRQRSNGKFFTFAPYSTALGGLVIPQGSDITSLKDLHGAKIGIAGGPLDKSWLLLQALALKESGSGLVKSLIPVFAAPPLLNQQLLQGRIDAVLNFWPYVARLEAIGMKPLISVQEITRGLGIKSNVPFVGYVFDESWAKHNPELIQGFLHATTKAKQILQQSNREWERIRPLMKAPDEATFIALRDGFRAGIPVHWGMQEHQAAEQLFKILSNIGGKKLVGNATRLAQGTFWSGATD